MSRFICVTSGKGGVGKTTLVANLAYELSSLGYEVIAMDANLTTPNLGIHLGLHLAPKTLHDILKGEEKIYSAIYSHPLGIKVIPASLGISDLQNVDVNKLAPSTLDLFGKADFIILDSAAGLGREAISAIQSAEEIILITNPDLPSVADCLKTCRIIEKFGKKIIGIVVNRCKGKWHELENKDIEEMTNYKIIANIPEDKNVHKSIALKIPLTALYPNSPASLEIRRVAYYIAGKEFKPKKFHLNILEKIASWASF